MIIVDLSPLENMAFLATKDVPEEDIEGALLLDMMARFNLSIGAATTRARPLIKAARAARRKVSEATQYEIRVVGGEA